MKATMRIIHLLLFIILVPNISMASGPADTYVYGVKIQLSNNIELNGYVEFDRLLDSCHTSDFDKQHYKLETWESYWERPDNNINSGSGTINFIGKLIQIKGEAPDNRFKLSWLVASRSSVKKIKFADIKRIKGVCKKFDGNHTGIGVVLITDYMAEYISNHKMIASYTFDHEHVPLSDEEYAYGQLTSYFSYNPEYPRERLMKQRKIIDKKSEDILNKNKLIRFRWSSD